MRDLGCSSQVLGVGRVLARDVRAGARVVRVAGGPARSSAVELLPGGELTVHRRQRDQAILRDLQRARDAADLGRRRHAAIAFQLADVGTRDAHFLCHGTL